MNKPQKSWAKEFKIQYNKKNWFLEILEAQIIQENPDVIYNTTLTTIPYSFIESVKQKLKKKGVFGFAIMEFLVVVNFSNLINTTFF